MDFAVESFDLGFVVLKTFFALVLGLVLGSFSTAVAYRAPRDIPWAFGQAGKKSPRSACSSCGATLQAMDLIPVFSWLIQKGKCRHCGAPISVVYPLSEATTAFLCLTFFVASGFILSVPVFIVFFAIAFLVALSVIDFEFKILPNQLLVVLLVLGALYHASHFFTAGGYEEWSIESLYGWGAEFGLGMILYGVLSWGLGALMKKILGKDALGMGDVKFFAVAGLWLGLSNLPLFCVLSGACGVLVAILWQKVKGEEVFPFGPALILAFYAVLALESSHFL